MIHIGFVIDNNYCKYLSVVISSILTSGPNNQYAFHIINDGSINDENKVRLDSLKKIKDFEIYYYAQNKKLHHEQRMETRQDIPMVTNYRLMVSTILKHLDKIIFMDADLIVVNDIKELWDIDVENYYMACCPVVQEHWKSYQKLLEIPESYRYCNTGVMVANLKKWRKDNVEEKLFAKEKQFRGKYCFYDQCIFNIALFDKIKYLNHKYNFTPEVWYFKEYLEKNYTKSQMGGVATNPIVIHWAHPVKPWQDEQLPFASDWWDYAKKTPYYWQLKIEKLYKFSLQTQDVKKKQYKWYQKLFSVDNYKTKENEQRKMMFLFGLKIIF